MLNTPLYIITPVFIVFSMIVYWKRMRLRMLAHPGTYFFIIWAVSVPSYYFTSAHGIADLAFPEYADELTVYVLFTAVCFLLFGLRKKAKLTEGRTELDFFKSKNLFLTCALLALAAQLLLFVRSGATFNMGATRVEYVEQMYERSLMSGPVNSLLFILSVLFIPTGVFAGYCIGCRLTGRYSIIRNWAILLIPFLAALFQSFTIGGRNPMTYGIKYYIIGAGFAMLYFVPERYVKRMIVVLASVFVGFVLFSTLVKDQRNEVTRGTYEAEMMRVAYGNSPLLRSASGIIEYTSAQYIGYQYRRDDWTFDRPQLGVLTFNGIFGFRVPGSAMLGLNGTVGDLLGVKVFSHLDDIADTGRQQSYVTNSVYIQLYNDFGYWGTFVFIVFFVWLSQMAFEHYLDRRVNSYTSIYFTVVLMQYWASSNFNSMFGNATLFSYFFIFLIMDFLVRNKAIR